MKNKHGDYPIHEAILSFSKLHHPPEDRSQLKTGYLGKRNIVFTSITSHHRCRCRSIYFSIVSSTHQHSKRWPTNTSTFRCSSRSNWDVWSINSIRSIHQSSDSHGCCKLFFPSLNNNGNLEKKQASVQMFIFALVLREITSLRTILRVFIIKTPVLIISYRNMVVNVVISTRAFTLDEYRNFSVTIEMDGIVLSKSTAR